MIVIDDLGYNLHSAERILDWPQPLTLGVLPYAPHSTLIAERAKRLGKEVILHQPMEPESSAHVHAERGMLEQGMSATLFDEQLTAALAQIPQAVGVNNHTGSRLTAHRESMQRLMPLIRMRGLFFLDSRTTPNTVAEDTAREWRVPTLRRDVFLDHVQTSEALNEAFNKAIHITRNQGHAVVIAHPHRLTLDFLELRLAALPDGVRLTSLQALMEESITPTVDSTGQATLALLGSPAYPSRSLGQ